MSEVGFDFNVNLMSEQWNKVKEDLYNGVIGYMELEKLLNDYMFFNRFDNFFKESFKNFEIPLESIYPMYRGAGGEVSLDNYGRMIPKIEYANAYNRMNPPGRAFIYIGILGKNKGRDKKTVKRHITRTLVKEIRASRDSIATICELQVTETGKNKTVISLCGDINIPESEKDLENYIRKQIDQSRGKETVQQVVSRVLSNVYFNMLSSDQIFKPIESNEQEIKKYEYAPFHALANYISEQGYAGIIFRSTVHMNGTNLVLFDTDDVAVIKESMEHIRASDYL